MSYRQNPYQPGTYGGTSSGPGFGGFTLGSPMQQPFYQQSPFYNQQQMAYAGGFRNSGTLIYPDTTKITQITCFKCRSYGHYANECPYR